MHHPRLAPPIPRTREGPGAEMPIARSKPTAQGQISVPAEIRKKLGAGPGSVLEGDAFSPKGTRPRDREPSKPKKDGGRGRNRTNDTRIFVVRQSVMRDFVGLNPRDFV